MSRPPSLSAAASDRAQDAHGHSGTNLTAPVRPEHGAAVERSSEAAAHRAATAVAHAASDIRQLGVASAREAALLEVRVGDAKALNQRAQLGRGALVGHNHRFNPRSAARNDRRHASRSPGRSSVGTIAVQRSGTWPMVSGACRRARTLRDEVVVLRDRTEGDTERRIESVP